VTFGREMPAFAGRERISIFIFQTILHNNSLFKSNRFVFPLLFFLVLSSRDRDFLSERFSSADERRFPSCILHREIPPCASLSIFARKIRGGTWCLVEDAARMRRRSVSPLRNARPGRAVVSHPLF